MGLLVIGLALPRRGEPARIRSPSARRELSAPAAGARGPWLADWHARARPARQNTGRRPADPAGPGAAGSTLLMGGVTCGMCLSLRANERRASRSGKVHPAPRQEDGQVPAGSVV